MKPDSITLDQRLDMLDRNALLSLMRTLLKEEPGLAPRLDALLASAIPPGISPKPRPPAVNPAQFRREAEAIMRPGRGYDSYGAASAIYDGIDGLLSRIQPLLDADDGDNALAALEQVMAVMVVEWLEYDDSDGELGMTFDHLGEMFTEAILRTDLAANKRATWCKKLEAWRDELADYGCEEKFELACRAVNEGWEEPTLRRILQGEDPGDLPAGSALADDALLRIRLRILESRGDHEAVLRLSRAVGAFDAYALALVRLGRMDEAENMAMTSLRDPRHVHRLAQTLQEQGDIDHAIRVAVGGLFRATTAPTTERYTLHPLAVWLRDAARPQRELALRAAEMAFTLSCELGDYAVAQEIAGNDWDAVRTELLARMAAADSPARPEQKVTLYLHEGMVDEAVRVIDGARFFHDPSLLRQTMAAAMASHPDWVIRRSRQEAEEIMNAGRANAYETATAWLHLTREAMVRTDRQQEWNTLLTSLLQTHHRKYKLRPLLEALNAPESVCGKGSNRS